MTIRTHRPGRSGFPPRDHYAEVTDRVIAALEAGTPPWRRPWDTGKAAGPGMPCNALTGSRYRGINVVTLGMSPLAFQTGDPRWATYRQAAARGWQVRKGARGTTGYFFRRVEIRDHGGTAGDDAEVTKRIPLLRAFTLFHASQIDGIPDYIPPTLAEAPWRAPDAAEIIVANSGVQVRIGGDRAFYAPNTDHIQMPPRPAFRSAAGWASTILHELGHASGAPSRLDRDLRNRFGSPDYVREEVRVELAQCMVCAELNIADCDFANSAAYIASWLETLRADRKEVFRAAADAQRLADYLLAFHPDWARRNDHAPDGEPACDDSPVASDTPGTERAEAA
jgi:antirestriction protein ArdC